MRTARPWAVRAVVAIGAWVGLAGASLPVEAGEILLAYARCIECASNQHTLSMNELDERVGAGLEAEAPSVPAGADDVAVILWDEPVVREGSSKGSNGTRSGGAFTNGASTGSN